MDTGFLPLRPGGLCYLVVPGGPTKAGDRKEAPAGLSIQALYWETEILYRTWGQSPVARPVHAPSASQ